MAVQITPSDIIQVASAGAFPTVFHVAPGAGPKQRLHGPPIRAIAAAIIKEWDGTKWVEAYRA